MPRNRGPDPSRTSPRWRPCARVINSRMMLVSPWRLTPSTVPSSIHSMARIYIIFAHAHSTGQSGALFVRKSQAHGAVALRIVHPPFPHFDVKKKMHGLLDNTRDLGPRRGADRLDALAALAKHDLALALAGDKDGLLNAHRTVLELLPRFGLHHGLIWQLLVQPQIELFPGDLRRQLAQRRI